MSIHYGTVDVRISDVHKQVPSLFENRGLLITCLDSSSPVALGKWQENLSAGRIAWRKIAQAVWIEPASVTAAFRVGETFYGFDEVYFLSAPPIESAVPQNIFTVPRYSFEEGIPEEFVQAFHRLDALGYLTDGAGFELNYAFLDKKDASLLARQFADGEKTPNSTHYNYP
jgi:hypothetical protein